MGEVLHRTSSGAACRARLASLVGIFAVLAVALVSGGELSLALSLPTLGLTAAVALMRPSAADGVVGRFGVRRGWGVYGLNELHEWRLTGEHFRFRVDERWFAVPLPASKHGAFETELELRAPERRSQYR